MQIKHLRLIAKALSLISFAFIAFFLVAHIFGEDRISFTNAKDMYLFLFFPLGFLAGLMLAWKAELMGSLVSIGSIAMVHVITMSFQFDTVIHLLSIPAVLFLFTYLLELHQSRNY